MPGGKDSRRGCPVDASRTPNGVADGTLSYEAVFFDPDHWDEIDTMADLNEAERMFDGKYREPAAGNGRTLHSRLARISHAHQSSARDPLAPVAADD